MTRTIGVDCNTSSLDRQGAEAEALRLPLTLQSPFGPPVASRTSRTNAEAADRSSNAPSPASASRPTGTTLEHQYT